MKNEKGFVGYFDFDINNTSLFKGSQDKAQLKNLPIDFGFTSENFLSELEIEFFEKLIENEVNVPVGVTGYYDEYQDGDQIGSFRGTIFTPEIAKALFERLKGVYPEDRDFKASLNSDHDSHSDWEFIGINPLFRFIKYLDGGELVPHYDAPFIQDEDQRTLVTMVIYLTNNHSGQTRFINDPQSNLPVSKRDLSDWKIKPKNEDILFTIYPEKGKIALFDHRIIHDCEPLNHEEKTIIRTDLMFKKRK